MAEDLVEIYNQYKSRGVVFIGVTASDEASSSAFASRYCIPWPVGFGAEKAIQSLGSPVPSIFIVGRDGRVVWQDDQSRFKHQESTFPEAVSQALEQALAKNRRGWF